MGGDPFTYRLGYDDVSRGGRRPEGKGRKATPGSQPPTVHVPECQRRSKIPHHPTFTPWPRQRSSTGSAASRDYRRHSGQFISAQREALKAGLVRPVAMTRSPRRRRSCRSRRACAMSWTRSSAPRVARFLGYCGIKPARTTAAAAVAPTPDRLPVEPERRAHRSRRENFRISSQFIERYNTQCRIERIRHQTRQRPRAAPMADECRENRVRYTRRPLNFAECGSVILRRLRVGVGG